MDKEINIHWKEFGQFLKGTRTRNSTRKQYIYYFQKFEFNTFTYENLIMFLEQYNNPVARSMLTKLKEFILTNYDKLGFTKEEKADVLDVKIPILQREIKRLPKHFSHEKVIKAIKALPSERYKLMGYVSYYGALRVGELMKLRVSSLNIDEFNEQRVYDNPIQGEVRTIGKADREGIAILPNWLMERISKYILNNSFEFKEFLFMDQTKLERSNIREWELVLLKAGIDAGITNLDENGKPTKETRLTPHKLRHSFAAHLLLDEKKNIRIIQEVLRHKSIKSTEIYTQLDKSELKKELLNVK